jgi:uncharacterized protein (UPF0276 family)
MKPAPTGLGLKSAWLPELMGSGGSAEVGFVEIHAENAMVDGGPVLAQLLRVRERYALSVHGVGLSLGGEGGLDRDHLARLARVVDRLQPRWVSEHLAWSDHGGACFNDLLPLVYDSTTLQRLCAQVDQLQTRLQRQVLIENPSTYFEFAASTMDEAQFIAELQRRSGCGLLLDLNNVFVGCVNRGLGEVAARAYVDALPLHAVGEVHLAGFAEDCDADGARLLIDSHGAPVDAAVWTLYEHFLRVAGPRPTLLERDQNLPPLAAMRAELAQAAGLMREREAATAPAREAAL